MIPIKTFFVFRAANNLVLRISIQFIWNLIADTEFLHRNGFQNGSCFFKNILLSLKRPFIKSKADLEWRKAMHQNVLQYSKTSACALQFWIIHFRSRYSEKNILLRSSRSTPYRMIRVCFPWTDTTKLHSCAVSLPAFCGAEFSKMKW